MPSNSTQLRSDSRRARLFRNGRNQALRIPREFEFPEKEVLLRREGDALIVEPADGSTGLLDLLKVLAPLNERFPDVNKGLPALDTPRF